MLDRTGSANKRSHRGRRVRLHWARVVSITIIILLVAGGASGGILYARPLPAVTYQPAQFSTSTSATAVTMPWPAYGQSAVGLAGGGILASSTNSPKQIPLPTASVAKVMTALAVLDKKPLTIGQTGPMLTITKADVDIYNYYLANDGSLAAVQEGEQISQYDALEALMLPSANNFADTLAIWAYGSLDAYTAAANTLAKSYGMTDSNFADASGFSPQTVSTANDLIRLGDRALQNPVLAEIFAKSTANIPVAGTINNVNGLLGKYGINGIKTGNTDQAGGVFLVSAVRQLADGEQGTLIACVMGAPNLETAMRATLPLLDATAANIVTQTVVKKGQSFGTYSAPWSSQTAQAVATKDVSFNVWKGSASTTTVNLKTITTPKTKGADAGKVLATIGSQSAGVPLALDRDIAPPTWWWRISHR